MRRRDKNILGGALIGGGVVLVADIILQWWDKKGSGEKIDWNRTFKRTLVGIGIGGVGGYLYYKYKIGREELLPFNSDEYLKKILTEENIKRDPRYFKKVLQERERLKGWLIQKYSHKLVNGRVEDGGSFAKRTAIASNYDSDIVLPFKKESCSSLEEMFYDVYNDLNHEYGKTSVVRKHSKAIGITIDCRGDEIYFDVLPGREINDYQREKELNLYVRPDWIWQRGSSFKTNLNLERNITVNKPEARQVIMLLKAYRDRNNFKLPTVIIEQCVVTAMAGDKFGIHSSITENLLNCMDFIVQKLNHKELVDFANSNNNLHDKMSNAERSFASCLLESDIAQIEENPRYISEIYSV